MQRRATAIAAPPRAGMFASLTAYPAIRWLWTGTLCTNTAFWMYQVALGWLALELTDSPFFLGLAGFAGGIPILILALPAGVVVDQFDRRTVLMFGQVGVMVAATLFSALIFTDIIDRWSMLIIAFAYGSSMAFVFPTRHAIIGRLVEKQDLANAIALNSAGQNATRIFGPALAGGLIAVVGIGGTFAVAAGLQIFALLTSLRLPSNPPRNPGSQGGAIERVSEGLRYVACDPALYGTLALATVGTVLIMPYINLMPAFARDELDLGSAGFGFLMTGIGIGSVIGALAVAGVRRLTTTPGAQVAMIAAWAASVLIFSQITWLPAVTLVLLISGVLSAGFLATNQTVLQLRSDEEIRGRVLGINMLTWGLLPVGQLPLGLLADVIGAPAATLIASVLALALIALTTARIPQLRREQA